VSAPSECDESDLRLPILTDQQSGDTILVLASAY
jgi:hypothetical protein